MPTSPPIANGFPRTEKCFESRHLSSSDFKVYHVMLACAIAYKKARNDSGTLIFQYSVLPWLCNAVPTSENNARKIIERLVEQGWLILLEANRYANGRKLPNIYQVVTHDEFLRTHPGSCPPNEYGPDGERFEKGNVPINFAKAALAALLRIVIPTDLKPDHDLTTPASRTLAEMVTDEEVRAALTVPTIAGTAEQSPQLDTVPTIAGTVSPHNRSETVPTIGVEQSPQSRAVSLRTSLNTSQHTLSPEPTVVGGVLENSRLWSPEDEVSLLLAGFVKHNNGQPGQCTKTQRQQLTDLAARHGRDKFRGAAKAWLKASPWDVRTTHPFSAFINGFESYAAVAPFQEKAAKAKSQEAERHERSAEFSGRKFKVGYGQFSVPGFLDSLTQADRDYIKQVADAKTLEEMPPDNGRTYQAEEAQFNIDKVKNEHREANKLKDDFFKDGNF